MNKKTKLFILIGILIFGGLIGLIASQFSGKDKEDIDKEDSKPLSAEEHVAYEILDNSVSLDEEITAWLEEEKKKAGFFTKKTEQETFVLISGGEQKTTGYGISLNAVNQFKKRIEIKYEVIAPAEAEPVEEKETIPHMLLRFASTDVKMEGVIATLDSVLEEEQSKEAETETEENQK